MCYLFMSLAALFPVAFPPPCSWVAPSPGCTSFFLYALVVRVKAQDNDASSFFHFLLPPYLIKQQVTEEWSRAIRRAGLCGPHSLKWLPARATHVWIKIKLIYYVSFTPPDKCSIILLYLLPSQIVSKDYWTFDKQQNVIAIEKLPPLGILWIILKWINRQA